MADFDGKVEAPVEHLFECAHARSQEERQREAERFPAPQDERQLPVGHDHGHREFERAEALAQKMLVAAAAGILAADHARFRELACPGFAAAR
jgi:hypothetical protein